MYNDDKIKMSAEAGLGSILTKINKGATSPLDNNAWVNLDNAVQSRIEYLQHLNIDVPSYNITRERIDSYKLYVDDENELREKKLVTTRLVYEGLAPIDDLNVEVLRSSVAVDMNNYGSLMRGIPDQYKYLVRAVKQLEAPKLKPMSSTDTLAVDVATIKADVAEIRQDVKQALASRAGDASIPWFNKANLIDAIIAEADVVDVSPKTNTETPKQKEVEAVTELYKRRLAELNAFVQEVDAKGPRSTEDKAQINRIRSRLYQTGKRLTRLEVDPSKLTEDL